MKPGRPQTPQVIIGQNAEDDNKESNEQKEIILKNFPNFMRQIVESKNDQFLNGGVNIIDYVIAKYLNISIDDLKSLKKLSIKVNGSYGLLNQFGQRLTELVYLKLNDSFIQSINDLGTNFTKLKILQINNCRLKDLSGIVCFEHLEIMEAKNNEISDLIELEMCSSIKKLDFENNLIKNEENIYFLASLEKLEYVNLLRNPIQNYEAKLKELLPNLKYINTPLEICENLGEIASNKFSSVKNSQSLSTDNESKSENKSKQDKNNTIDTSKNFKKITNVGNSTSSEKFNNNAKVDFCGTRTKFDFNVNLNELQANKDLKPIVTKKKENKEIKLLRDSFTKGSMNSTGNSSDLFKGHKCCNCHCNSRVNTINDVENRKSGFNFNKIEAPNTGVKFLKDIKNKNLDKIVMKGKIPKNDKFFEELKNIRLTGKK